MYVGSTLVAILALITALLLWTFVQRYKKCPPNKILVITGRTGQGTAKCVHGGAAFVWPVLQEHYWLDLEPFVVPIELTSALSRENIRVSVPTTVTAAISTQEGVMQNAAVRLLSQGMDDIKKQAQDIILGQMRAVIATMKIEEINRDRQAFLSGVKEAVSEELEKIGLQVINVNIKDIEDDSGYIQALGRKAAAEAINQAQIDVAEQEKIGKSGVAERERDRRRAVAGAESEASVGESMAERDRRTAVAAANSEAAVGEAEADRNRRKQMSILDAEAVETETRANSQKAGFMAGQKVAEEEARAQSQAAAEKADGSIRVAREDAQRLAEEARAKREQARLSADIIVPAEAARQKAIVEADAEKQRKQLVAAGEADATLVRMQAEARGQQAILEGKAAGYRALVEACNNDPSMTAGLLLIEKLLDVARVQTEAVKNLPIDKIMIWDGAGNGQGGLQDLGSRLLGVLPPMHELAKIAGLELPEYLGRAVSQPGPAIPQKSPAPKDK